VYNHASTLLITWIGLNSGITFQWMTVLTNVFVNVIMYYYYIIAATGLLPWWRKYLTILYIYQFIINNLMVVLWLFWNWYLPTGCSGNVWVTIIVLAINSYYFLLFLRFYSYSYIRKVERKNEEDTFTETQKA